jgi:hypothetical protein
MRYGDFDVASPRSANKTSVRVSAAVDLRVA